MKEDRERRQAFVAEMRLVWNPRAQHPAFNLPMGLAIPGWLLAILGAVLAFIMSHATPILREKLVEFFLGFYREAKESENAWDDYLALFLLIMFGIPIPEGG